MPSNPPFQVTQEAQSSAGDVLVAAEVVAELWPPPLINQSADAAARLTLPPVPSYYPQSIFLMSCWLQLAAKSQG